MRPNLLQEECNRPGDTTAGFLRLYDDTLLETPLSLPPSDEQKALVEYLYVVETTFNNAWNRVHDQIELMEEYQTRAIAS